MIESPNVAIPSPTPALRSRSLNSNQNPEIQQTRSPIPAPRNRENRQTDHGNYRNIPLITVHRTSSDNDNNRLRRQNGERSSHTTNSSAVPRGLIQSENSPTARLIHKLFRNRDPAFLPGPSSTVPIQPRRSNENPTTIPPAETRQSAVPPIATYDSDDSEYHSIDTLSLHLDISRSITPPPAYKSIFIDEEANVIQ